MRSNNLNKYQEDAKRTMASLGSYKLNLAHMVIGMSTELGELIVAIENKDLINIGEEVADQFWYIANYCTLRNLDLNVFEPFLTVKKVNTTRMFLVLTELLDINKKFIAYKKEINIDEEFKLLHFYISELAGICKLYKIDLSQALVKNINKLKVRYPEKFNTKDATLRDLNKERKVLET
jgi:NTP pyrophosphatase (non-canonical NTP hydrolase)